MRHPLLLLMKLPQQTLLRLKLQQMLQQMHQRMKPPQPKAKLLPQKRLLQLLLQMSLQRKLMLLPTMKNKLKKSTMPQMKVSNAFSHIYIGIKIMISHLTECLENFNFDEQWKVDHYQWMHTFLNNKDMRCLFFWNDFDDMALRASDTAAPKFYD
jgi:hypothetical protein